MAGTAYRAVQKLAEGGMGEVYEVEHLELGRRFVAKLVHQDLAGDRVVAERLQTEARILAELDHPNVVSVFNLDKTKTGQPFLIMPLLRGRTLAEELRIRGEIPVYEAVDLIRQALLGVQAAHEAGIVHRDIKPSNLFLAEFSETRVLQLIDFGVSKVLPHAGVRPGLHPTEEGVLVGTPRYASPEQAMGEAVSQQTDLYACSLVLYELIAGRGPFDDSRALGRMLKAHSFAEPKPPSAFAASPIPAELDRLILHCLEKKPSNRPRSAADVVSSLDDIMAQLKAPVGWAQTTTFDADEARAIAARQLASPTTDMNSPPASAATALDAPARAEKAARGGDTVPLTEAADADTRTSLALATTQVAAQKPPWLLLSVLGVSLFVLALLATVLMVSG